MLQLVFTKDDGSVDFGVSAEEVEKYILSTVATDLSDRHEFLQKLNKITFGLMSRLQ